MEVDVIFSVWCTGVSATGSTLVGALKGFRLVKQIGSLGRFERDSVLDELCQIRVGFCMFVSQTYVRPLLDWID